EAGVPSLPFPVFARLHLNAWHAGDTDSWVTKDQYAACVGKPEIDPALPMPVAVDAASKRDTTAVQAVQRHEDGKFHAKCWHFKADEHTGVFDYGELEDLIREVCSSWQVPRVAFDPY